MKTYNNLYERICSFDNLYHAYKLARKDKTNKSYVIIFEENLLENLNKLRKELLTLTYNPRPLKTFILRDPKTRVISKSEFRDRIVHHALHLVLEPIFDKIFIYDSYANRKGKGNIRAVRRFDLFKKKISQNGKVMPNKFKENNYVYGYCFKADIKHYFDTVDRKILLEIIQRKIIDEKVLGLIKKIIQNFEGKELEKGMPLGNLTSQFFANVYLNELDYFIKHQLIIKYYIRYVDDFVILHQSKRQLETWKEAINNFLLTNLKIGLHPQKSKIIPLAKGVDFVGFRVFYHFKLPRKRNIRSMRMKVNDCKENRLSNYALMASFKGWRAYVKWTQSYKLRKRIAAEVYQAINAT